MRIGRTRAQDTMGQVVRVRADAYDLTRPTDEATGRFGESDANTTTIKGVQVWLQQPRETDVDTQYGVRLDGDLIGRTLPDADIAPMDRLEHGTETYEVQTTYDVPDERDPAMKLVSLDRVVNDG